MTELLCLDDAYLREFTATVTAVDTEGSRVALDRSAFYPTGGGQAHDTGSLAWSADNVAAVTDVRKEGDTIWHTIADAHRHAHPLRRRVERVGHPGHRQQHGPAQRASAARSRSPTTTSYAPRSA